MPIFLSPLPNNHGDSLLATFELVFQVCGKYALELELFNTLGPTGKIFVSGVGEVLDGAFDLGSA